MSEFVRPDQKTILREPSNIVCKEDDRLRLLVVVYSAPVYYERRRIIRKTWGDALRKIPGKIGSSHRTGLDFSSISKDRPEKLDIRLP